MLNLLATTLSFDPGSSLDTAVNVASGGGYYGDILVSLIIVLVIILYGALFDAHMMFVNLVSIYIAFLLSVFSPLSTWMIFSGIHSWLAQAIVFIFFVLILNFLILHIGLLQIYYTKNFFYRWIKASVTGFLHAGLIVSIVLSMIPSETMRQFSPSLLSIFTTSSGKFWWIFLPIVGLLILKNPKKQKEY